MEIKGIRNECFVVTRGDWHFDIHAITLEYGGELAMNNDGSQEISSASSRGPA